LRTTLLTSTRNREEQVMRMSRVAGAAAAVLVSGAVLVFPLAGISGAPKGPPWKSSVPFSETVFNTATSESVTLSGTEALTLHVSGNVITGWTTSLKVTLQHTTGVGATTGKAYKAKGTDVLTATFHPGPPTAPTTYPATFALHPPSPCRAHHPPGPCFAPSTVSVPVTMTLNADGSVASVQVGHSD
jgi:hypothetical protein